MSKIDRQLELERLMQSRGMEKMYKDVAANAAAGREFSSGPGARICHDLVMRAIPAFEELHANAEEKILKMATQGGRMSGWEPWVLALSPARLSFITVQTMLYKLSSGENMRHNLAPTIGTGIIVEIMWDKLREAEKQRAKETGDRNRIEALKRHVKAVNKPTVRKWIRMLDDLGLEEPDNRTKVAVGAEVLNCALVTLDDIFQTAPISEKNKTFISISMTDAAFDMISKFYQKVALNERWYLPMATPPKPWDMRGAGGGYLTTHKGHVLDTQVFGPLFVQKKGLAPLTETSELGPETIDAINKLQTVPMAINAGVLRAAKKAVEDKMDEILPVTMQMELPPKVSDEVWAKASKEDRRAIRGARREVYDNNFKNQSKRLSLLSKVKMAEMFENEPELYFPQRLDFRRRLYPVPQDLTTHSDDFARGLLRFSKHKQLGQYGYEKLAQYVAKLWGHGLDKESSLTQYAWTKSNRELIEGVANGDLRHRMAEADEPWQFLAACQEMRGAWSEKNPYEYWSSLPVTIDGTCNGLQHLSAMALDPFGSKAVNLAPGERQDIYQIVADNIDKQVRVDAKFGKTEAQNWYGKVTRKAVKRAVMTVPYGVTKHGMLSQLLEDRSKCWPDVEGNHLENGMYLRDMLWKAVAQTLGVASEVMTWMRENAQLLAKNNKAVHWTSPTGDVVEMKYLKHFHKVYTLCGVMDLKHTTLKFLQADPDKINKPKQVSSIVPNIIHSFDAAHLAMTVARLPDLDLVTVHDCFGTHACDVWQLEDTLKDTFIEIYSKDWFHSLYQDMLASRGTDDFPLLLPPNRGSFDINEVRKSAYFFS